jgi:hypothetical protein
VHAGMLSERERERERGRCVGIILDNEQCFRMLGVSRLYGETFSVNGQCVGLL